MYCTYVRFQVFTSVTEAFPTEVLDVLVGHPWSNNLENNASGSIATGKASDARQVKGDDPD
jgi:hypothetical protein